MKAREFLKKAVFSLLVLLTVTMIAGYNDAYAASQVEIEENGTHLTLNESSRHTFIKKGDEEEKWYIFDIDKRGYFRIKFNTTENTDGDKVSDGWWWGLYRKGNLNSTVREWSRVSNGTSYYYCFEPGTYYLRVKPTTYYGAWDCEYEVTVLFNEENTAELEANDNGKDANSLEEGVCYSGTLKDREDEDWYKIHLDKTSALKVKLSVDERTDGDSIAAGWKFLIYDSSFSKALKEYNSIKSDCESMELPLGKGDYYICVKANSIYDAPVNGIYNITAFLNNDNQWEAEYNDENGKATTLTTGEKNKVTGTLYWKEDVDWYKVKISKNGYFNIRMYIDDDEHHELLKEGYLLELYYKDMTLIGSFDITSKVATQELPFRKGIYYIKVKARNSYYSPVDYKYGIDVIEKSSNKWERENNDDVKNATKMSAKIKMYRGYIYKNDDADYFMFDVKKKGKYTISISKNDSQKIFSRGWNVELLSADDGRVEYKDGIVKSDSIKATLAPGKYYIKITGNGYYPDVVGAIYKLTVKSK